MEMNISPQSSSEFKEGAKEPLLISEFHLSKTSSSIPDAHTAKQSSVSPLSQHREYGIHTKTRLLENRKSKPGSAGKMNEYTASAVHPRPAIGLRYRLEMPKLTIPSRKTIRSDIMPPPQISVLPKLPSVGNREQRSLVQTTVATTIPVHTPSSAVSVMLNQATQRARRVQRDKLLPLQVSCTQSTTPASTSLPVTASVTNQNQSPNLQLKPISENQQDNFRFKVPKGRVGTYPVNSPGTRPLHVSQPADKVSSSSCSMQYSSNQDSPTTITSSSDHSSMDWSSAVPVTMSSCSSPGEPYSNLILEPAYQGNVSMQSTVAQLDQTQMSMAGSRNESIQFQDNSYSSVGHATGDNVSANHSNVFDVSQMQTHGRDVQDFTNQQSMVRTYVFAL